MREILDENGGSMDGQALMRETELRFNKKLEECKNYNMSDVVCGICHLKMPITSINNRACSHMCIKCNKTVTLI